MESVRVCQACENAIEKIELPCLRCGAPLHPAQAAKQKGRSACIHCKRGKWPANQVYCLTVYQDLAKQAVIAMKQPMSEALGTYFGNRLATEAVTRLALSDADLVISVPHHWWKRITHRHNASEMLASVVARRLQIPLQHRLLVRTKQGVKQGTLSRAERARNIEGAFELACKPELIKAST